MVMVVVFRFKLRLMDIGVSEGPHEIASNCMGVGRGESILCT